MKDFFNLLTTSWWGIVLICLISLTVLTLLSSVFYKKFFKRLYDILLSAIAIIFLSPLLLILIITGSISMKGNPFFYQRRPGKNEKIFKLIKFRTMNDKRDKNGELLPDEDRLTKYGKFLRATSLDELPEIFNIFIGKMSFIGPRPLLEKYLPLYNNEQRKRHNALPGLTGYAQVNGRNCISWKKKFELDVYYVENMSLWLDIKIFFATIFKVIKRDGINSATSVTMEEFTGDN